MMLKKIISYSTPLFFMMTAGVFALYNYFYYSTIPAYEKKLTVMVHDRAQEINNYLNQQEKNAVKLSQETTILDAFSALEDILQQVQDERKAENNSSNKKQSITTLLAAHKEIMGFKNVFLI